MITVVDIACAPSAAGGGGRPGAVVSARGASGAIGLGEATPVPGAARPAESYDDCARAVAALRDALPLLMSPPTALEFGADLAMAVAPDAPAARFAIETALCDLAARTAGWPLARVLVAQPAPAVPVNALVASADDAAAAVARGFGCVKVKLHGAMADDLARVRAVRARVGAGVGLRVDGNLRWPADEVAARLAALAELGVEYVEEPAPGVAARARAPLAAPLALDESLADPDRDRWLDDALGSGAIAAVILKPGRLGGLAASLALAARARAHGVAAIVTHGMDGAIALAAACELARAVAADEPPGAARRAHGLDRHDGVVGAVPQLVGAVARDSGRAGLGLDPAPFAPAIAPPARGRAAAEVAP